MRRGRFLAALVVALFGVATTAASRTPPDVRPDPKVGWILIGVQPANANLNIGEVTTWRDGTVLVDVGNIFGHLPVDGFILMKAKPGKLYGISSVSIMAGSVFGTYYGACDKAIAFRPEAGKVVYFTSLAYRNQDGSTDVFPKGFPNSRVREGARFSQDLEGARAFLKAHYPNLADSLEQGQFQALPSAEKC
jgi:hypothetical protein